MRSFKSHLTFYPKSRHAKLHWLCRHWTNHPQTHRFLDHVLTLLLCWLAVFWRQELSSSSFLHTFLYGLVHHVMTVFSLLFGDRWVRWTWRFLDHALFHKHHVMVEEDWMIFVLFFLLLTAQRLNSKKNYWFQRIAIPDWFQPCNIGFVLERFWCVTQINW